MIPYNHQSRMLDRCRAGCKRFGMYWDTGLGKTYATLLMLREIGDRAIIVTKPSVLQSWSDSGAQLGLKVAGISNALGRDYYHGLPWLVKGKLEDMRKQALQADIVVVSHETLHKYTPDVKRFNVFIFDESQRVAGHTTRVAKAAYKFAKTAEYCYLLSATPMPNSVLDAWPQNELLYPGSWGPRAKWLATHGTARLINLNNPWLVKWYPHRWAESRVKSAMSEYVEYLDGSLCPDMPAVTPIKTLHAYMTPAETKKYNEYNKFYALCNNDTIIKRLQISTGQVYTEQGIEPVHNAKIPVLLDAIKSVNGKVIVWVQFEHEKALITQALANIGIKSVLQKQYHDFIADDSIRVLIAHPGALGTGTDGLQRVCSNMIWYSIGSSFVDYYQAIGRLKRIGALTKIINNMRIITNDTFENIAWRAVEAKRDLLEYMREMEDER